MNDSTEYSACKALAAYAEALRDVRPSAHLDARIEAAINDAASNRFGRVHRRGALMWLSIAASGALFALGLMLLTRGGPHATVAEDVSTEPEVAEPLLVERDPFSIASPAHYSLFPNEAEVFRVRANLGATGADERQYWVDVRIANDGSMRIVRVVPADSGEWLAE